MGKIKEAYFIQQEIIEFLAEDFELKGDNSFNLLEFCYETGLSVHQGRDFILALSMVNVAEELWNGNYKSFKIEEFIIFNDTYNDLLDKYLISKI